MWLRTFRGTFCLADWADVVVTYRFQLLLFGHRVGSVTPPGLVARKAYQVFPFRPMAFRPIPVDQEGDNMRRLMT